MADAAETTKASGRRPWIDYPDSDAELAELARRVGEQQARLREHVASLGGKIDRGQHQKQLLGAFGTVRILDSIPAKAKLGAFRRSGIHRAAVRFSNGQPCPFADQSPDVRGIAVKFFSDNDEEIDLLATNEGGRSHSRDAATFMDIGDALIERIIRGNLAFGEVVLKEIFHRLLGPLEAARSLAILLKETSRKVESAAAESYWGSVVKLGDWPVKYSFHPHASTAPGTKGDRHNVDYLRADLQARLAAGPVKFRIALQFFVNEEDTPVNDASIAWKADRIDVAELEIPRLPNAQDEAVVGGFAFSPSNGFEPLGITRARKAVYEASAKNRNATPSSEARRYFPKVGDGK
jgi:catalase